jgi:hypothetical protein
MKTRFLGRRILQLVLQPRDTWTEVGAESGRPGDVLWPGPAVLCAVGPVSFLIGHGIIGHPGTSLPFGRFLGWATVYYTLLALVSLLLATLLRRIAPALETRLDVAQALKLSVHALVPFWIANGVLLIPVDQWESLVIVSGMVGLGLGALLLGQGLVVMVRAEARARGLLAAAGIGAVLSAWILGFFLLKKIVL